jgi:hypothetical protein
MTTDYKDVVVKKPWGYEYLVYENESVGLWFLHIDSNHSTSMHCHPNKNTGLVLLEGDATTSFLNDRTTMSGLKKLMIRRGLFHSTLGSGTNGANIFEIESPRDKKDLVRLNDKYGREGKPYEDSKHEIERDKAHLWIEDPEKNSSKYYYFCGCEIKAESITEKNKLLNRSNEELFIFLKGGIISKDLHMIAKPGDVISSDTLDILLSSFDITEEIVFLSIVQARGIQGNGYGCP